MFERLELLIGKENLNKIKTKHILVIGLGGVGSYVVESLIRSGIENITIVDFDKIDISNLNRQLMTNLNNIGKLKEIREILKEYEISSLKDKNIDIDVIEDQDTFVGNAKKKALEIYH